MINYNPCGICGQVGTELTAERYRGFGRALGLQIEPDGKFIIGGDIRASTPELLAALSEGLCEAGVDVVDLGQLPTPMIYYAHHRLHAAASAIVTASHHAPELNGLKWLIGGHPPAPEEVAALWRASESSGTVPSLRGPTTARSIDVSFDYVAWLQETWADALGAQFHVVLEPMHGGWAVRARHYLHAIFPQCIFSAIHDTPEAAFAGHNPDCSRPQLLEELCEAVYRQRAHVGFAFDDDGDRVAVVDNEGMPLTSEETTWVLLQSFGPQLQDEKFIYDPNFSDRIAETADDLGAEAIRERGGQAFVRRGMVQTGALFGADVSGHYFFRALQGADDGLFTACWLIAYLARSRATLSHVRRECPPIYITPDLHVPADGPQQEQILERIRAAWSEFPQQAIDGVRIDTPGGWVLARSSATQQALTFRFESSDWHSLDDLVEHFCTALPEVGATLWSEYEAAMGTTGPCG